MNKIWIFMIVCSFVMATLNGNMDAVTKAMFDSTNNAVQIVIGMIGLISMWSGFMKVAEKSGLVQIFSKALKPIIKILFPNIYKNKEISGYIGINMSANILGLGNVATPIGIKTIEKLDSINRDKKRISDDMLMFIVLNTASIQLIPTTVIALRSNYGSENPTSIILPTLLSSVVSVIVAICIVKIVSKKERKWKP